MNKCKIAAGINTFNDAKSLRRTLESLIGFMDRIYIIDGRYPDYATENNEDKYSNDGTFLVAEEFGKKYGSITAIEYHPLFAEQRDKRTLYLKVCKYDFLLVIDADEYLEITSWQEFQDQLERYILNMSERYRYHQYQVNYQAEPNKFMPLPRLIYKPNQLMYTTHWSMIADPVDNMNMTSSQKIDGITIVTNDNLRPDSRLQTDIDYQWNLFYKEQVIDKKVYLDAECKQRFRERIIHEIDVWKVKNALP